MPRDLLSKKVKFYINPGAVRRQGAPTATRGSPDARSSSTPTGDTAATAAGRSPGRILPRSIEARRTWPGTWPRTSSPRVLRANAKCKLAYAIGIAEPVSIMVETFGTAKVPEERIGRAVMDTFDLRPARIIRELNLLRPIYRKTAALGHFGREAPEFTWEKTDKVRALRKAAGHGA